MVSDISSRLRSNNTIKIPASKSYLQRYIILASLCPEKSTLHNINLCDDVLAVIETVKQYGARIEIKNNTLEIKGIQPYGAYTSISLNIGESGLAARTLGILSSLVFQKVYLSGKGSILQRSMKSLIAVLEQLGCKVKSNNSHLPLEITASQCYPHKINIPDAETSQIITGLLFALPLVGQNTVVEWQHPTSIPYIDMSIQTLNNFGIKILHDNHKIYSIQGKQTLQPVDIHIEGDWSNAAFFIVLGAIKQKVRIEQLNPQSLQGDKIIVDIVKQAGAQIAWEDDTLIVQPDTLTPIEVDLRNYPDLFPPLVVLSLAIQGTSVLHGVERLFNKESNRAETLMYEFKKLGGDILLDSNKMIIRGKGYLNGGIVNSHNDHRIVMAATIAQYIAQSPIEIINPQAVNKSFPEFFEVINQFKIR